MNNPLVSIIIPTFNRAHIIGETLDSVLVQTYTNWECIVVDDGSTDNTPELIKGYCNEDSRFKFYSRSITRIKGGNSCRNLGLELSQGAFLVFLDSDDILGLGCLEKRLYHLYKNNEVDFLVFQSQLFINNKDNSKWIPNALIKDIEDLKRFISYDYPWNISATLLRKCFLIDNNIKWNENLAIHQDLEFYIQVLAVNPKYKKIEDIPDVYIRMGTDDKISSSNIIEAKLIGKHAFFESLAGILKREKLYNNDIALRVYGLSLLNGKLYLKNKLIKLLFKTFKIYFNQGDFRFSFFIFPDVFYLFLREKISSYKLKKAFEFYEFVLGGNRFEYMPPKGSTLGKIKLKNYLHSLNK